MSCANLLDNNKNFVGKDGFATLKQLEVELLKPVLFPINSKIGIEGDLEMIGNSTIDFQGEIQISSNGNQLITSDISNNVVVNDLIVLGDLSANLPVPPIPNPIFSIVKNIPPLEENKVFYDLFKNDWYSYSKENNFPCLRNIPTIYTFMTINVSNETELTNALLMASFGTEIVVLEDIILSAPITISQPTKFTSIGNKKISFNGNNQSTIIVQSDLTTFQNITIESLGLGSNDTAITFNNTNASENYVDNCVIKTNEFGIATNNKQIQISNNIFEFVGTPDSHRFISLQATQLTTIIYGNTFIGHTTTQAIFMSGAGSLLNGKILIENNTNENQPFIQRLLICERDLSGSNVSFYFAHNYFNCLNGYAIFFSTNALGGIKDIFLYNNTEVNIATGAKGMIGIDAGSNGVINDNVNVYSDDNTQFIINAVGQLEPYVLRADYSDWTSNDSKLVAYQNVRFSPLLQLDLQEVPIILGKSCKGYVVLEKEL